MTGAQAVVESLKKEGVEIIFGYPGGAVLTLYDALYESEYPHILTRHEQGAIHAADGYARATGKPGVVMATSGPGATNLVTGIATAYMDSIPMVIISGQVPTAAIGLDAFQEVDTVGITRPCVKHNFLVKRIEDLATTLKKAFYVATTGRPGPVLVDIPKDVSQQMAEFVYPASIAMRSYQPEVKADPVQVRNAVEVLLQARRPMVYAGGGVVLGNAAEPLRKLVQALGAPCTTTLMGLGAYPGNDPLYVGMPGMHGTYEANLGMQHCDVLLAVGARFDDRVIGNPQHFSVEGRRIIHIDIDPSSISKRVRVDMPLVGDVGEVLGAMLAQLQISQKRLDSQALTAWWQQIEEWRGRQCLHYEGSSTIIKPQFVVESLYQVTGGEAIVTSDVGQHQMWAAQYYLFNRPRQWLNSGGLGTMGFGLPAAMGAQLAFPDTPVACVTGEASIQMCIQELSTCKQYHLPVKIVNLNNRYLGMVRQWQQILHGNRYSESYMDALPDFVKLAESYGHVGLRIERPEDVEPALREAFSLKNRVVFLDFQTDPTENVFPMVKAGKGLTEMLLGAEDL